MQKYIYFVVGILIAGAVVFFLFPRSTNENGTPTVSPTPTPTKEKNIIIEFPKPGAVVENPIRVTGKARVFEATYAFRLRDANEKILFEGNGMTTGPSVPEYGNFDFKVAVPAGSTKDLFIEVFEFSAKDGSVTNLDRVPVTLATTETSSVKVFFSNNKLDPAISCTKVFPIVRPIIKTKEVGFVSLFELLRGVLPGESSDYYTSIPKGTQINSLVLRDGTAYADFNYALEYNGGGSCHVQAVRAQIEQTLLQFPTIKKVVITVNGRGGDVLQP
jgi:immunoglobulin-like protein involved in spore germination/sporulation and spore germination protein